MALRRYKKDDDLAYSIGVFPTLELLRTRLDTVVRVLISSKGDRNTGVQEICTLADRANIPVQTADTAIRRLSGAENIYAIGVFRKYESPLQCGNHLVLVRPSDMGNMGTIARTAVAFGVVNLAVIEPAVDIFDPRVIRASMGAIFRLHFAYLASFAEYKTRFHNHYYPFMTDGKHRLPEVRFCTPFSLIFGSEGEGLDDSYSTIGSSVQIPQSSEVDSLNLAVAVGIGLYASSQQRCQP